ncbi:hypothetical protein RSAG8_09561, partial [Rhizoctonia solani AG-8 WAC10335]
MVSTSGGSMAYRSSYASGDGYRQRVVRRALGFELGDLGSLVIMHAVEHEETVEPPKMYRSI